jgi:conserved hypothetical protein
MEISNEQISFKQSQLKIVDIYSWLEGQILQYKIKIQRNSAWRNEDREEFIDTIINGYPIPPIFISSGILDEEKLVNIYHVLDGRQRLETIQNFINKNFTYKGKQYDELDKRERVKILNYFVPIITIDDSNVKQLKEIFKRLNKTAIKLNRIEITSSQYFEYSFIIFSKLAVTTKNCKMEIENYRKETELLYRNLDSDEIEDSDENTEEEINENTEFKIKDLEKSLPYYEDVLKNNEDVYNLFNNINIFSAYEINRQVNLQHFLNIFVTIIDSEKAISRSVVTTGKSKKWQRKIEEYSSDYKIKEIVEKYNVFKKVCCYLNNVYSNLDKESLFYNKSSLYTLCTYLFYNLKNVQDNYTSEEFIKKLNKYLEDTKNMEIYKKLVQDQVNEKNIRSKRYEILETIFNSGQNK